MSSPNRVPLSPAICFALAKLVDDARMDGYREPSHSQITSAVKRCGLQARDPKLCGETLGKAKRVQATLMAAFDDDIERGERYAAALLGLVRGCGGFRHESPNYVGKDVFENLAAAFRAEGRQLTPDGELLPDVLEALSGAELTDALERYVVRSRRGIEDAALAVGTGKDLLEAVAKHVVMEKWNAAPPMTNFPNLLGQAFEALGLATPERPAQEGEGAHRRMERALYELGCSVNSLRNKEGTGHGRPWLPRVTAEQARTAVESMGVVSGYLLARLRG